MGRLTTVQRADTIRVIMRVESKDKISNMMGLNKLQ